MKTFGIVLCGLFLFGAVKASANELGGTLVQEAVVYANPTVDISVYGMLPVHHKDASNYCKSAGFHDGQVLSATKKEINNVARYKRRRWSRGDDGKIIIQVECTKYYR